MSISIGNGNKIEKSTIAETIENKEIKNRFFDKHPVICSFLISIIAGVVLLFSFWNSIIKWIEGWF